MIRQRIPHSLEQASRARLSRSETGTKSCGRYNGVKIQACNLLQGNKGTGRKDWIEIEQRRSLANRYVNVTFPESARRQSLSPDQ